MDYAKKKKKKTTIIVMSIFQSIYLIEINKYIKKGTIDLINMLNYIHNIYSF